MLELAIKGGKKYYGWMTFLLLIVGVGFLHYLWQLDFGLGITG
ncbi:MAG: menaquinol oxidoreductase, partial [Deltaproteobacteria bacterium]|nr:menaquinol oxidoreductase [Deltaproteobacteria bacterium]